MTTSLDTAPVQASASARTLPFRHPVEEFEWNGERWDIARFWRDIDAGRIKPKREELGAQFIEAYASKVLALDKNRSPAEQPKGIFIRVDAVAANALPKEAMDVPLVILRTPKNKGILQLDDQGVSFVLGDGNHRVAKAYLGGRDKLSTYVLNREQSRRYRIN